MKYHSLFPSNEKWDYPNGTVKESSGPDDSILAVHVYIDVQEGKEKEFAEASLANATESVKEEGVARFDVLQQIDDPKKFVLVEVYKNADAPAAHKATAHYATWRDTVADFQTRSSRKFQTRFPAPENWGYP